MAETDLSSDDKALALGVFMGCFTSRELVRSCDPTTETSFEDIIMPGNCNKIKDTAKEDLLLSFNHLLCAIVNFETLRSGIHVHQVG
jgi:hypothetical protein